MANKHSVITSQIRDDVRHRSRLLSSRRGIVRAIFDALIAANVDWRRVALEDVKRLLVDAIRAFRRSGVLHLEQRPS